MVKRCLLVCVLCTSCGPGLRDGTYPGEARFVLHGSIANIQAAPGLPLSSLRISVVWQMVALPHPAPPSGNASDAAAPETPTIGSSGTSAPANPNSATTTPPPPLPPTPSNQPTSSGQDPGVANVAFPAPVSLTLYDQPETEPSWPAAQAEGTVLVFYDVNGDGRYDAATEPVASSLQDQRLLYVRDPNLLSTQFVNSILDNPGAFVHAFTLAARTCAGAVEHLSPENNQDVSLVPGAPTSCQ